MSGVSFHQALLLFLVHEDGAVGQQVSESVLNGGWFVDRVQVPLAASSQPESWR